MMWCEFDERSSDDTADKRSAKWINIIMLWTNTRKEDCFRVVCRKCVQSPRPSVRIFHRTSMKYMCGERRGGWSALSGVHVCLTLCLCCAFSWDMMWICDMRKWYCSCMVYIYILRCRNDSAMDYWPIIYSVGGSLIIEHLTCGFELVFLFYYTYGMVRILLKNQILKKFQYKTSLF